MLGALLPIFVCNCWWTRPKMTWNEITDASSRQEPAQASAPCATTDPFGSSKAQMGWTRWRLEWSQHDHWVKKTYWEKIPAMRTVAWPFSECFCDYVNVENICIRRVWLAMLVHTDANRVHVRSVGIVCLAIRLVWLFDYIWLVHAWPSGPRRCWGHLGPFWLQQGECGLNKI